MKSYTYSQARQKLAEVLKIAGREGQVEIRRRDGRSFVVQPVARSRSPLDVPGVDSGLSRTAIVQLVRESRRSTERLLPSRRRRKPGARAGKSSRR